MPSNILRFVALASAISCSAASFAQDAEGPGVSQLDVVQVTANHFHEQVQEVPNSIEVISGDELRARGVNDLRTALALASGVTVQPGGDEGPSSASPALLGTRESDDFLLVVDGVPAGGAFIPQYSTIDLHNVERIEIQRGAAPVFYGTTAFAGTINIVHYSAGSAESLGSVTYGSYGSVSASGSGVISNGAVQQSISADFNRDRFSDSHEDGDRVHAMYRLAAGLDGGLAHLDFDALIQHQKPTSPQPLSDDGTHLTTDLPNDFNQNPSDGKIDTNRFQLTGGYDKALSFGSWSTTLSLTQTQTQKVQGFLDDDYEDETAAGDDTNAAGFHAKQHLFEAYFDTHLTSHFGKSVAMTYGINELYGVAHQTSQTFAYFVPLDGSRPDSSGDVDRDDPNTLADIRSLFGVYTQARWTITSDLGVLAGLRINHTDEGRSANGMADAGDDDPGGASGVFNQNYHTTRPSGSIGTNWRVWHDPEADFDDVTLYASFSNTFQQPQIDFGPDDGFDPLLKPETQRSFEAGVKTDGLDGRFDIDLSAFLVGFGNQTIAVDNNGTPGLASGGSERYTGLELETSYRILPSLKLTGNYSYNDSRYRNFSIQNDDGDVIQLAGNHLPLSAQNLGALGLVYADKSHRGLTAAITGNYIGGRFLDMENTVRVKAYETADASIGYAFEHLAITVNGYNLSNRRDPVLESELGDGHFYLLQGRRFFLKLSVLLGKQG